MRVTSLAILVVAALAAATPTAVGAQNPKLPPNRIPTPQPGEAVPALPEVDRLAPPAALSGADLKRRLRALGRTFPDALPPGATTTLGPDRLRVGRTWLVLEDVERLDPRPGWAAASFEPCGRLHGIVWLEFDAAAHARYVLDAFVSVGRFCNLADIYPPPVPPFRIHVQRDPAGSSSSESGGSHEVNVDAGHILLAFQTVTNGRHRVAIYLDSYRWAFYRVDLTRLPSR